MLTLWPYAAAWFAGAILALILVLRGRKALIGVCVSMFAVSIYYVQSNNENSFILTWGRPLFFVLCLSVFVYLLSLWKDR